MMGLTIKNHWPVMIIDDLPFIEGLLFKFN